VSGPEVMEYSDEIRYYWRERHIMLVFTRLHETDSGRVVGFISVVNPDRRNGHGPERLYWQSVTLTTASDRKTLCGKLEQVAPLRGAWEQDIDRCFLDAYERHTAVPEPVILSAAEDVDLDVAMLIDPLLPEGLIALLLADQGTTKSYLMLYLAVCVCLGCETVFGAPSRSGPAIFFDWEVDERTARRRLGMICRGLGVAPPRNLHYVDMSTRGRIFDRIRDMRHMVERIKPALVLIDSLTFATGADLSSAEYAAPTMTAVGSLGEGVTKLVSTHPTKAARNAKTEDISVIGSGLFEFRARAIWHMRRMEQRASRFGVSLTPRKPFDGPPQNPLSYRMVFDNEKHLAQFQSMRLADEPALEASTMSYSQRIRRELARRGKLDTAELSGLTGIAQDAVRVTCNRMPDVAPFLTGEKGKPTMWMLLDVPHEQPVEGA